MARPVRVEVALPPPGAFYAGERFACRVIVTDAPLPAATAAPAAAAVGATGAAGAAASAAKTSAVAADFPNGGPPPAAAAATGARTIDWLGLQLLGYVGTDQHVQTAPADARALPPGPGRLLTPDLMPETRSQCSS